ncbi:hypothetical protein DXG01_013327 [Tephrocybe rancida]|nr:hypothetical protein DXG01_013327 [Tephrocybe rancida]
MGNSSSSGRGHHDESVDYGSLSPQGVYTGLRDWNQAVVTQLICSRRLAPFYRPLEDYEENWDDDQILAARKELPASDPDSHETITRVETPASSQSPTKANKRPGALKEPSKPEAAVYRGAVECPICFLSLWSESSKQQSAEPSSYPTHKRRQKSFGADSPEVVTTDQIRPDWEAKLAAVRAAVTRRANRRIIMRQVGDRLIPVGVTSGRVHALTPEEAQAEGVDNGGSRRRRRQQNNQQNQNFEQFMGMGGQDLEEVSIHPVHCSENVTFLTEVLRQLMLMEAMRLSMIDHEEHQRKEAEEKRQQEAAAAATTSDSAPTSSSAPGPSTLEPTPGNLINLSPSPSTSAPSTSVLGENLNSNKDSPSAPTGRNLIPHQPGNSSSSSLQHRSPSPAPFSTLSAVLSTASTASAILGRSPSNSSSIANGEPASVLPISNTDPEDTIPPHNLGVSLHSPPYDILPSSAESLVAYEPLLGSRAPHEEHDM